MKDQQEKSNLQQHKASKATQKHRHDLEESVKEGLEQHEFFMKLFELWAGVSEVLIKCHRLVSEVTEKVCHTVPVIGTMIRGVGLTAIGFAKVIRISQSGAVPLHKKLSAGVKTVSGLGMIAAAIVGLAIPPLGAAMVAVVAGIALGTHVYKSARTAYKLHKAKCRQQKQSQAHHAELLHQQAKMKTRQYNLAIGLATLGIAVALVFTGPVAGVILTSGLIAMNVAYVGKKVGLFSRIKRWFGRSLRRSRRKTLLKQSATLQVQRPSRSIELINQDQSQVTNVTKNEQTQIHVQAREKAASAATQVSTETTVERSADNLKPTPGSVKRATKAFEVKRDKQPAAVHRLKVISGLGVVISGVAVLVSPVMGLACAAVTAVTVAATTLVQQRRDMNDDMRLFSAKAPQRKPIDDEEDEDGDGKHGLAPTETLQSIDTQVEVNTAKPEPKPVPQQAGLANRAEEKSIDQNAKQQLFLQHELSALQSINHDNQQHRSFHDVHPAIEDVVDESDQTQNRVEEHITDTVSQNAKLTASTQAKTPVMDEVEDEDDSGEGRRDQPEDESFHP